MARARDARRQLRALMRVQGWQAPDVAAVLYVRPQTVRAWLCGVRRVPPYALPWLRAVARH